MSWHETPENWTAPPELAGSGPRPVRLSGQGKAMAVATALIFAGGIAMGAWMWHIAARDAAARAALDAQGIETQGTVTRRWITSGKSSTSMVAYEFEYQGRTYQGRSAAPRREWEALPENAPIAIRFVPGRPELNHPSRWEKEVLPAWLALFVAASMSVGGFILVWTIRRQIELLRDGTAVPGRVTGLRRAKGGKTPLYEFALPDGTVRKGRGCTMRNPPEVGTVITVLYDRERPRRNAPYPVQAARVASR